MVKRALDYMGVDPSFYRREGPERAEYVFRKGSKVSWKRELKPFLCERFMQPKHFDQNHNEYLDIAWKKPRKCM